MLPTDTNKIYRTVFRLHQSIKATFLKGSFFQIENSQTIDQKVQQSDIL